MRGFFLRWGVIFLAVYAAIFPVVSLAATVTDITDQPTSTQVSTASNHSFVLTLSSSVADTGVMQIVFPDGFDLTSIVEDDVDISDDGVALTTAADCSGSEMVGVSVAANSLVLTECVGDGGAISSGSVVTILIGTNAVASGSGTHRIVNPSAAATYFVNFIESGGGSGSVVLVITSTSGTGVAATVTGSTPTVVPDEGGGGDCSPDEGSSCTSGENSCGMTSAGTISCSGLCSASIPSDDLCFSCVAEDGESCASAANSCGLTDGGTIGCDGSCSAVTPSEDLCSVCATDSGSSCASASNSCGMTSFGTVSCDGTCTATAPSESLCATETGCDSDMGSTCTSSANSCGLINSGTIACSGVCSATIPSESACSVDPGGACDVDEGVGCTTDANSCGQANSGVIGCDGSCSASRPSEDGCPEVGEICDPQEGEACTSGENSCALTNRGVVTCDGSCSATVPDESFCGSVIATPPAVVPPTTSASASEVPGVSPLEAIRALPEIQAAVDIAIPLAVSAGVVTMAVLASSFSLLQFLQFWFTSPFLFFARRKRKAYGVVYNSLSKVAIDLATVRLYDTISNRLVKSAVTDAKGRYFFVTNPGQYRLTVAKNGFVFPSVYLAGVKDDGLYLDVYTGQVIAVTEHNATIAANIPLDVVEDRKEHVPSMVGRRRLLRKFRFVFSASGMMLSLLVYFFSPSLLTASLAIGQVIVFCLFWRLAIPRRPKGWGVVYDNSTRRPVGKAIVRLFEPKYNKLVETTLTDSLGRYSFLVGPNEYFVRADKEGYEGRIIQSIDYRQKTEPEALIVDVPLEPKKPV